MDEPKIANSRVALTATELDVLQRLVSAGDRAGFYMAYYDMTGSSEAALQAKIATFSENEGGFAYAANWLLMNTGLGPNGTTPGQYPGIYYLSQKVALSAFSAIESNLATASGTGLVTNEDFFASAQQAWAGISNLFPGNIFALFLGGFNSSNLASLFTTGTTASLLATFFASDVGKRVSDFSGYTQIQGPDGSTLIVDSTGRVTAVGSLTTYAPLSALSDVGAAIGALSPEAVSNLVPAALKDVVLQLLQTARSDEITAMLGGQSDWSSARTGLSEFSGRYNGDTGGTANQLSPTTIGWKAVGTSGDDVLQATSGQASGGGGNDLIFGSQAGDGNLAGDAGNDIIWGRGGADHIDGGAGDDILRGGADNDFLRGGAGNDIIDGGDINLAQASDGRDTALFDDQHGGKVELSSTGSGDPLLLVKRGDETDTLHSIEKIVLSDGEDKVIIASGTDLHILREIDAGDNPSDKPDTLDLSSLTGNYSIVDSVLVGKNTSLKLTNFEKIIGLPTDDKIILKQGSINEVHGGPGNDTIVGGLTSARLFGDDGNDVLIAGRAGDILDGGVSNGAGDKYVSGAGADTFVIGNGVHINQGTDNAFTIQKADATDKLVLRLADTLGASAENALTKGIVLSGGTIINDPHLHFAPDEVVATFSPIVVGEVTGTNSDGAFVDSYTTENKRAELGDFFVLYDWQKSAQTLDIFITSAYGDFSVHVDGYQEGQLGLTFGSVDAPLNEYLVGSSSRPVLEASWATYLATLQALPGGGYRPAGQVSAQNWVVMMLGFSPSEARKHCAIAYERIPAHELAAEQWRILPRRFPRAVGRDYSRRTADLESAWHAGARARQRRAVSLQLRRQA